nr:MAG TPA: hypothetical protein [Bacteriophage sp.]
MNKFMVGCGGSLYNQGDVIFHNPNAKDTDDTAKNLSFRICEWDDSLLEYTFKVDFTSLEGRGSVNMKVNQNASLGWYMKESLKLYKDGNNMNFISSYSYYDNKYDYSSEGSFIPIKVTIL